MKTSLTNFYIVSVLQEKRQDYRKPIASKSEILNSEKLKVN